jgi:two-component system phosphate regulon sensor histidine kinase PhoR
MKTGVRARLLLFSVGLLLLSALVFAVFVDRKIQAQLSQFVVHDAGIRTALAAERIAAAADLRAEAPRLAAALGQAGAGRVTIIDPAGIVRGDSEVPPERLGELENHAGRPEVAEARKTGSGTSERDSSTVHEHLVYAARRVDRPDGPWVVRVAFFQSTTPVQLIVQAKSVLAQGTVIAVIVAIALSFLSSSYLTRSLRALAETARAMRGDLSRRARIEGSDEVAVLGASLDELTSDLEGSIRDLSSQRDQLEAMLESMQEGVMIVDGDGLVRLANRALREMLVLDADIVGRSPLEVVRNAGLHELFAQARQSGRVVTREIELLGVRRLRVLGRASPLSSSGGGIVAVLSDVTELRRLEVIRRDFVANVSHELRTPVASIRAASETLAGGAMQDPHAARDFIEIVTHNAERLQRLIDDLLELSRAEAEGVGLRLSPIDVGEACSAALQLFRSRAAARRTELVLQVPEGLAVRAEARALEQVLTNLLDNAIKYSPPGSHVTLRAVPGDQRVIIEVEDDAAGIEAHHLPRLFERFYRVDASRSRELGGTGLGLAIVKHLVEALGGTASVTSKIGKGTTFRIELLKALSAAPVDEQALIP